MSFLSSWSRCALVFILPASFSLLLLLSDGLNLSLSCWRNKQSTKARAQGQRATVFWSPWFWWEEQTACWQCSQVVWERGTVKRKTLSRQSKSRKVRQDAPRMLSESQILILVIKRKTGWLKSPTKNRPKSLQNGEKLKLKLIVKIQIFFPYFGHIMILTAAQLSLKCF